MPFETATGNRATLDATLPGMELLGINDPAINRPGPEDYILINNYPNPFNPSTAIKFHLPAMAFVNLAIHNIRGEKIRTLVDRWCDSGDHIVEWDGLNDAKQSVAGGVYIYMVRTGTGIESKKMLLLR
jgi:hypothetical protein